MVEPLFHIALYEPEIHPNTGNIGRLCAATETRLHLIEPLGFRVDEKAVKRAGLDYWPYIDLQRHVNYQAFQQATKERRCWFFTTKANKSYTEVQFQAGDCLVFGPETRGLPSEILAENQTQTLLIPMLSENVRSLNLATAVGIALYEALRQMGKTASNRR